jgi:hypothetical protein
VRGVLRESEPVGQFNDIHLDTRTSTKAGAMPVELSRTLGKTTTLSRPVSLADITPSSGDYE